MIEHQPLQARSLLVSSPDACTKAWREVEDLTTSCEVAAELSFEPGTLSALWLLLAPRRRRNDLVSMQQKDWLLRIEAGEDIKLHLGSSHAEGMS